MDYILFLTADVTVTPNLNEIRDYKYVNKEELQAMFDDPGKSYTTRMQNPLTQVIQPIPSPLGLS